MKIQAGLLLFHKKNKSCKFKNGSGQNNYIQNNNAGGINIKKTVCIVIALLSCFITNSCASSAVRITLPTDIIELYEKFDFEALRKEKEIKDVTENADGSFTVKMSKDQQTALLGAVREIVDESINDILQDEIMSAYYVNIIASNDCKEVQAYVPGDQIDYFHEMGLLPVTITCMIYQAFSGVNDYGTHIVLINNETNETISENYFTSDDL